MSSLMQQPYLGKQCHTCSYGNYKLPDNGQEWHVTCGECGAILFCYTPMPHQHDFHADTHKFRMYAGGFGSAKTSTCAAEMVRHVLETPNGYSLIGAATLPQLEQTAKKDFLAMMPEEFILERSLQKNIWTFINGHQVLFRPLDDEGKARSLNLTAFWIEEASEVKYDYFAQLQTRLRNHATQHHMGIISTNPDLNWIRSEFLLKSDAITGTEIQYFQDKMEINPDFSTHIAKTEKNIYLPPDYRDSVARGKPNWWIERYLNGSFEHTEGAVYPTFMENVVEPFEIPAYWERLFGVDFGLVDPTVMLAAAIDPKDGTVYLYDEYYKSNDIVPNHSKRMKKMMEGIPFGKIRRIVADPSGKQRNSHDNRSLYDHYAEYGIFFEPGYNRIEDGIMKVYTYFEMGKLKIFSSLANTIREGQSYKYKPRDLNDKNNADEKPEDKDNHTMDCFRYICQELPDDPSQLINRSIGQHEVVYGKIKDDGYLPYALQEDDEYGDDDWYNSY